MQVKSVETKVQDRIKIAGPPLDARNDKSIRKLLDVISSILADEYIQIAKENPDVFENGGTK
ncbi:MAG: hypothetical protein P9X22_08585 [Candidatus Zapsychrus exili]|nr:hypothetical protein [Candidatus Zapsychrus exili]